MDLINLLTKHFCDNYKIDIEKNYNIERINAKDLIVPGRIDLIAKLKYIEFREKGYDLTFIKQLYKSHIEAFTFGAFSENGNNSKNNIYDYFNAFNLLIDEIKKNGFDENISIIPVGQNNEIMDGAHRTAIAAYFDLEIPIIRFDHLIANNDTNFFRQRMLDEQYLDYLVTEYCKSKDNLFIAICWPRAKGEKNDVEEIMLQLCKIIYKKKVYLTYNGLRNLIIQIYCSCDWLGGFENRFNGATPQVEGCYDKDGFLTVYVLECNSIEKIINMKEKIRAIYNIGNYSIHTSDNKSETIKIANLLFNQNTINLLNYGAPDYYIDLNRKIAIFKDKLIMNNLNLEEFIIDSSSILGLYGLRDVNDIDFITVSSEYKIIEEKDISNHHDYIHFYNRTIDDLVMNPNNYLFYNDIKFITLNILREFKSNRNEKKDQIDIKLIDSILKEKYKYKLILIKIQSWFNRKYRNLKYFMPIYIMNLSKKIGIYREVRQLYHFIKDRK